MGRQFVAMGWERLSCRGARDVSAAGDEGHGDTGDPWDDGVSPQHDVPLCCPGLRSGVKLRDRGVFPGSYRGDIKQYFWCLLIKECTMPMDGYGLKNG